MNNLVESKALVHTAASYYRGRASYSTDQRLFAALFEQVLGGVQCGTFIGGGVGAVGGEVGGAFYFILIGS